MLKSKLLQNTFIISIGTISTKILSMILVPLYTIWLNPSQYGKYDLLISLSSLIVPCVTLQLEQSVFRAYFEENKNKTKYIINSLVLVTILNIIVDIVIVLFDSSVLLVIYCVYINLCAYYNLMMEFIRGNDLIKIYSLSNIIYNVMFFIFAIILVGKLKLNSEGLLTAAIISYIIIFIINFIILNNKIDNKIKFHVDFKILKDQLIYSAPLIPNNLGFWVINLSDRFLIMYFLGSYINGIYALGSKIPTIIVTFFSAFSLAWQQEAISINKSNISDDKKYKEIFFKLINGLFSMLILVIPFLKIVYKFFINERYYSSIYIVPILLYGTIFLCLSQFLSGISIAKKQTRSIGATTVIAAIVNLGLNVCFLKEYGVLIAAMTTVLSYGIMFILRIFCLKNRLIDKYIIYKFIKYTFCFFIASLAVYINNMYAVIVIQILMIILFFLMNKHNIKLGVFSCNNKKK